MKSTWRLDKFIATGLSPVHGHFSRNSQKIHVCVYMHTHISMYFYIYACMLITMNIPIPLLNYRVHTTPTHFQIFASLGRVWNTALITSSLLNIANLPPLPGCSIHLGAPRPTYADGFLHWKEGKRRAEDRGRKAANTVKRKGKGKRKEGTVLFLRFVNIYWFFLLRNNFTLNEKVATITVVQRTHINPLLGLPLTLCHTCFFDLSLIFSLFSLWHVSAYICIYVSTSTYTSDLCIHIFFSQNDLKVSFVCHVVMYIFLK